MPWEPLIIAVYATAAEAEAHCAALVEAGFDARVTDAEGGRPFDGWLFDTTDKPWKILVPERDAEEAAVKLERPLWSAREPGDPQPGVHWPCGGCGEQVGGAMTACWSCGTARPGHGGSAIPFEAEMDPAPPISAAEETAWEAETAVEYPAVDPGPPEPSDPAERLARRALDLALWGILLFPPILHMVALSMVRELERLPGPIDAEVRAMADQARRISWVAIVALGAVIVFILAT